MLMAKIKRFVGFCLDFLTKNRNSLLTAAAVSCLSALLIVNMKISHEAKALKLEKEKAILTKDLDDIFGFVNERNNYLQAKEVERLEMIRALGMQSEVIRQLFLKIQELGGWKKPSKPTDPSKWISFEENLDEKKAH